MARIIPGMLRLSWETGSFFAARDPCAFGQHRQEIVMADFASRRRLHGVKQSIIPSNGFHIGIHMSYGIRSNHETIGEILYECEPILVHDPFVTMSIQWSHVVVVHDPGQVNP